MTASSNIDWQTIITTLPGGSGSIDIYARQEYTSGAVADAYDTFMQSIAQVFNKANSSTDPSSALTAADVAQVQQALAGLYGLAQNGIVDNSTAPPKTWYLNTEMASNLSTLAKTFIAAGVGVPGIAGNADQLAALKAWKDLSITSSVISTTLSAALDNINTNRSLQAMIELEYVKTANDLVETKLGDLQDQLATTNGVLNVLASAQDLHNKITVTSRKDTFNYTASHNSPKTYLNDYLKYASVFFGGPVTVKMGFSLGGYVGTVFVPNPSTQAMISQLIALRASLTTQVNKLDQILTPEQKQATGNLYTTLKNVLDDINAKFQSGGAAIQVTNTLEAQGGLVRWLLDQYNDPTQSSSAGAIQTNITKAITAAQSLNQTQSENVKNYLFVFEQYYQSASTILQAISQLITKMAQGIRN